MTGQNQNISSQADMAIGDNSFGYVVKGTGTKLTTNATNPVTVGMIQHLYIQLIQQEI